MSSMNQDKFAKLPSGIELCYREAGQGKPLLMIMGLSFQLIHWPTDLIHALTAAGYRVITFDNRDAGRSSRMEGRAPTLTEKLKRQAPEGSYSLSDMAQDAFGLLDHLGIERAHVLGMSLGGMIAQVMAAEHGERVLSLTSIFSTTGAAKVGQPGLRMMYQFTKKPPRTREAFIERSLQTASIIQGRSYRAGTAERTSLFGSAWERGGTDPHKGVARQMNAIFASGDRTASLSRITAPTLVIHGDRDPLVHSSGGRATAKAIPGAQHIEIKGMGHELPPSLVPVLAPKILEHLGSVTSDLAKAGGV